MISDEKKSGMIVGSKVDQLAHFVKKEWGHEEWIVNNSKYCGKKLVFKKNYRLSLHYHKIKEETFYVMQGKVFLELIDGEKRIQRIMTPGDIAHIKPGVLHRLTGMEESEVIEFSTFHMDEDSYRVELSGYFDASALCCERV